jgi:hypothetical protein
LKELVGLAAAHRNRMRTVPALVSHGCKGG